MSGSSKFYLCTKIKLFFISHPKASWQISIIAFLLKNWMPFIFSHSPFSQLSVFIQYHIFSLSCISLAMENTSMSTMLRQHWQQHYWRQWRVTQVFTDYRFRCAYFSLQREHRKTELRTERSFLCLLLQAGTHSCAVGTTSSRGAVRQLLKKEHWESVLSSLLSTHYIYVCNDCGNYR